MPLPVARPAPPPAGAGDVRRLRVALPGGASTSVYVARYDLWRTDVRVVLVRRRLADWCAAKGATDAIVGGFFVRPDGMPLGEVRTRGVERRHVPFAEPWGAVRACVHVQDGVAGIAFRDELPAGPRGDLLQAGPLLVRDGREVFDRTADREGFSAGAHQFDSDITDGRHPRAALAISDDHLIAVACDGRSRQDAGLSLEELAGFLTRLGAHTALNLDGGGSTSLVTGGRLVNRPRSAPGRLEPGGRVVSTALVFSARA